MQNQVLFPTTLRRLLTVISVITLPIFSIAQTDDGTTPTAITSNPTCITAAGILPVAATYQTLTAPCDPSRKDVWYTFVAKSTRPTITITVLTGMPNTRIQVYNIGALATATTVQCSSTPSLTITGALTIGTTYRIRIYDNGDVAGTFNLCVTDPAPINDNCVGAISLVSGLACSNVTGNLYAATNTATTLCTGTSVTDLWYTFVAGATEHTITLSGLGTAVTNARLALYSGTCGTLTVVPAMCNLTTINPTTLTPGTTYYVRVYLNGGAAPNAPTNAAFSLCLTNPVANDEIQNAINLPIEGAYGNAISGNIAYSTVSTTTPACGSGYDIWYKFTARATALNVEFRNFEANYTNRQFQVVRGAVPGGPFTEATGGTCVASTAGTYIMNLTALTVGTVYYIRVGAPTTVAPTTLGRFNICVWGGTIPPRYGTSYVNITKRVTGGVVEPGDVLEIRMAISYDGGSDLFRARFFDSIPTNTTMRTTAGNGDSIRVITNQGYTWQKFTTTTNDDAASYLASPGLGQYNIRTNLAFNTTTTPATPGTPTGGTIFSKTNTSGTTTTAVMQNSTTKPLGNYKNLFAVAYRVTVTGAVGSTITLGPAVFMYRTSEAGADIELRNNNPYQIRISAPQALCANTTGINAAAEFGGTFGHGTEPNRSADLAAPISGYTFFSPYFNTQADKGETSDGRYAIVKNLSGRNITVATTEKRPSCPTALGTTSTDCSTRMFGGYWDITGDHTGQTGSASNAPAAAGSDGGYMLVVNSDNIPSVVYSQTINNLCPNTYYEFSAWIKNVCGVCGTSFLDNSQTNNAGVNPNLSFMVDGVDRYSTGEVAYVSDLSGWTKRGFVFTTGALQTSATFAIRTNSQGGGGNDWAIDDIGVATCLPTLTYTPSLNPDVCANQPFQIDNVVRSFFSNYTFWKWQKSTDDGLTWGNVAGQTGTSSPTSTAGQWQYPLSYTLPAAQTTTANNGDLYRVVVATTALNLSSGNCEVTDGISQVTLNVVTCGPALKTDLLSFSGKLNAESKATLSWTTSLEDGQMTYNVERSEDGANFTKVGTLLGYNNGNSKNTYSFVDFTPINGKASYRITMVAANSKQKRSTVVLLTKASAGYDFGNVINPFTSALKFEILINEAASLDVELLDATGKTVRKEKINAYSGVNSLSLANTDRLNSGVYTLRIVNKDKILTKRVLKSY